MYCNNYYLHQKWHCQDLHLAHAVMCLLSDSFSNLDLIVIRLLL